MQELSDLQRTYYPYLKGYFTLRIPNSLVCNDEMTEKTADYIAGMIKYKPEKGDIPASSGKKIKYPGPQYNPGILCVNLPVFR